MPRKPSLSFDEAVKSGNHRLALEAVRDRLADELVDPEHGENSAPPVAALAKTLVEVLDKLKALPDGKKESTVDELAKRRAARRSTTSVSKRAASGVKRGAGGGRARG